MDIFEKAKWFLKSYLNYLLGRAFGLTSNNHKLSKMELAPELELKHETEMEMEMETETVSQENTVQQREQMSIVDLNDDCLIQIFSYLDRNDLMEVADVSEQFYHAAHCVLRRNKKLDIRFHRCNTSSPEKLFKTIGSYLKQIDLSVGYSIPSTDVIAFITPLVEHCCNLEEFAINYIDFNEEYVEILQKIAPQLRVLNLCYCNLDDEIVIDLFMCCHNLQELYVMGNYRFDGKPLKHLTQLSFLSIERLPDTVKDELLEINPNLVISSLPFR